MRENTSNVISRLQEITIGNKLILYGTAAMDRPPGSPHVRSVEFRCVRLAPNPVVTATAFSPQSAGEAFAVFNVKVNDLGGETQIVAIAQRLDGHPSVLDYQCNVIAVGMPAK
jgi:hypothetical protein